ncbi:magnesium chelatase, partial [Amycolatopsis sp. NPDC058278]
MNAVPDALPRTAGALRAAGYEPRPIAQEIHDNLLSALKNGEDAWPGIVGFSRT